MMLRTLPFGGPGAERVSAQDRPLFRPDFAWEFLRRNPRYRLVAAQTARTGTAEMEAARPWGLAFLADPGIAAPSAEVFWRPEAAPFHLVWLEALAADGGGRVDLRAGVTAQRQNLDGLHLRFACGLQGLVRDSDVSRPLAAVLPISGRFSAALRAAGTLERQLRGEPPAFDLTLQQRIRLGRALQAYDAAAAQATYREIALGLFGQEAIDRHDWRTSSVRDTVIRLVRSGRELVGGGYRRLLLGAGGSSVSAD